MNKEDFQYKIYGHLTGIKSKILNSLEGKSPEWLLQRSNELEQVIQNDFEAKEFPFSESNDEIAGALADMIEAYPSPLSWHEDWIMCAHVISNFQPEKAADWPFADYFRRYMAFFKAKTEIRYISNILNPPQQ